MIDQNKLYRYRMSVFNKFEKREAHAVLMRFMCRCLEVIQDFLPAVGKAAFEKAKEYWLQGRGQACDLESARVDCWQYLDNKGRSIDIKDHEDAAMRAVLCVLYPHTESKDFSSETVEWFAEMLNRLGNYSNEVNRHMMC
jgi:hypothetical protein